ncbi:MAG: G1 family glutamic endopeptidase [Vulcanimicrobiaceae bacterium]
MDRTIAFTVTSSSAALAIFLVASSSPAAAAASTPYARASVHAVPGALCNLHSVGAAAADGIPVVGDNDGYARFYARRAVAGDPVQRLVLDCVDAAGKQQSFNVDLRSDDTFAARPLDTSKVPGFDRPALRGDPMSQSQAALLKAGYGLRPDPILAPDAYARWLAAASINARVFQGKYSTSSHAKPAGLLPSAGITTSAGPPWIGAELTGAAPYSIVEGTFNIPEAIPGGDGTGTTKVSIWVGLDGAGGPPLIQTGAIIETTPTSASYSFFREYCCGDGISNTYASPPQPNPGDEIYVESYYCDATGNQSETVHLGCMYLQDGTSGIVFICTQATDPTCPSVPPLSAWTNYNQTADFIMEFEAGGQSWPDFTSEVVMAGSAYSIPLKKQMSVSNDPAVNMLTDWTISNQPPPPTNMAVLFGPQEVLFGTTAPGPTLPSTPSSLSSTEDDSTQMTHDGTQIHICPSGTVMVGVDTTHNRLLCSTAFVLPNPENLTVDATTHASFKYSGTVHSVHVCPANSVMVGWNEAKNWLVCAPDLASGYVATPGFGSVAINGPGGTQVPEPKHPSIYMHSCDAPGSGTPYAMQGMEATDNVLVCLNAETVAQSK